MEHWGNYSLEDIEGEEWRPIPNFEDCFHISSLGRIKSIGRITEANTPFVKAIKERIRVASFNPDGYLAIRLSTFRQGMTIKCDILVHRLVGLVFVPNPLKKAEINHKDRDKKNNCAKNIEWVTRLENQQHFMKTGGEKTGPHEMIIHRLSAEQLIEISKSKETPKSMALKYKIGINSIYGIRTGRVLGNITGIQHIRKRSNKPK